VNRDEFLTIVRDMCSTDTAGAEAATEATLETLAERLPASLARRLVEQLPPELGPLMFRHGEPEKYDVDAFVARVAERSRTQTAMAKRQATCVLAALARALPASSYDAIVAELPEDFTPLLPRGRWVDVMPADEFVRRVAQRLGIDEAAARTSVDATLETLSIRLAGGEVEDLLTRLPLELHEPLKRGLAASATATRMPLDTFVSRLAEREGVDEWTARERARAVLHTLREAVGDDEFFDVTVQLPPTYDALWAS
jgi:uncharacterized protein (DUF2267 family)